MRIICFFGSYQKEYSRNLSFLEGLEQNGTNFFEIYRKPIIEKLDNVSDINLRSILRRISRIFRIYLYLLKQHLEIKKCDTILVLYPGHLYLIAGWIQSKINRKKLVFDSFISLYNSLVEDKKIITKGSLKACILKKIESLLLKLPDIILVDTEVKKILFSKVFNIPLKKIRTIPLTTSQKLYYPLKMKKHKKIVVTFFGLYNPLQGAVYIAKAGELLKNEKNIEITMIGEGKGKDDIVRYTKENNIKNIRFLPNLKEKELVKKIQQSDIMLGIFSNENAARIALPNKVVAAIACKKPLISAELPALKEYFTHKKNILFCKPEDPYALAKSITQLAENISLQKKLGENGYKLYQTKFAPEMIANQLLTI